MLYRYAKAHEYDMSKPASLNNFKDGAQTSAYATEAMQWAVGNGLFVGNNDGTLKPQGTATRAELATVLTRFCSLSSTAK